MFLPVCLCWLDTNVGGACLRGLLVVIIMIVDGLAGAKGEQGWSAAGVSGASVVLSISPRVQTGGVRIDGIGERYD